MFTVKPKNYTKIGYIPELGYYLLRDNSTSTLELWQTAKYITPERITNLGGVELEFVREVRCAYRVHDNDYNRVNASDDIGRIYIDKAPSLAEVQELR